MSLQFDKQYKPVVIRQVKRSVEVEEKQIKPIILKQIEYIIYNCTIETNIKFKSDKIYIRLNKQYQSWRDK